MANQVEISSYDPAWPIRFVELARSLRSALLDVAVRIDHIGSTAVPGLAAKPIIDVQISIRDFDPQACYQAPLEALGFVFRSDNAERTKRYFREPPGTPRTHVHVRRAGSWAEQFALLFRDYLRAHPEDARRYEAMKRVLAERYRDDRQRYSEEKGPLIWQIMGNADRWSQETGWVAGASDA